MRQAAREWIRFAFDMLVILAFLFLVYALSSGRVLPEGYRAIKDTEWEP